MEDKITLEYFLTLLDEGERVLTNDRLAEKHTILDYELKERESTSTSTTGLKDLGAFNTIENSAIGENILLNCKDCLAWKNRIRFVIPILNQGCKVMFILPAPEGMTLLTADSDDYFKKWCKAIDLSLSDISLTTLIKCPTSFFKTEYADSCKSRLREEMLSIKPKVLCLLGSDLSRYMLRKELPFERLRGRKYAINNIPTYVTYSPRELVENRNLRGAIWEDLKLLKEAL